MPQLGTHIRPKGYGKTPFLGDPLFVSCCNGQLDGKYTTIHVLVQNASVQALCHTTLMPLVHSMLANVGMYSCQ